MHILQKRKKFKLYQELACLMEKGNYKESLELIENEIETLINSHGDKNEDVAELYHNAGTALVEMHQFNEAEEQYHNALRIFITLGLNNTVSHLKTMLALGTLYLNSEDFKKAIVYFEECLEICNAIGEIEYSLPEEIILKIAQSYYLAGLKDEAITTYKEHLAFASTYFNKPSKMVVSSALALAQLFIETDHFDEAESHA